MVRSLQGVRGALEGALRQPIAALVGAALLVSGCGEPFVCRDEAIRATLRTPLVSGEDALSDEFAGNFESDRDENPELEMIERAIEGDAIGGRGISMWLQRGLDHTVNLSLWFPTPLRSGDVLPVVGVHSADSGAFWGTVPNPPAGLSVGVRLDAFVATSAAGSARLVRLDSLAIDLDVVASGSGRQFPIQGRLSVRHETSTGTCFE